MRAQFICSVCNEAVMNALFKIDDNKLTFSKAVEVAAETEDAAKAAKETVHGSKATATPTPTFKVNNKKA